MSRLSNFLLLSTLASFALSHPITSLVSSIQDELDDDNYDIIIDQRQNGTENFRIRIDGLSVAIPSEEFEHQQDQSQITEAELASLLGIQTTTKSSISLDFASDDKNDFANFASIFDFKKNLKNSKKNLDDTQSRTKDIPTDSQLSGDTKKTIKDYVKGEGRKYKLLVGERYIIPLLQFLRRNAAAAGDD